MGSSDAVASTAAPGRWLVIEVARPIEEERASEIVEELAALASGGVEEDRDRLRVYLPDPGAQTDLLLSRVRAVLEPMAAPDRLELTHWWQPHEEWNELWRRGLAPRRITDRLVVTPTWERMEPEPGDLVIELDPGMAFGTAEHATTRGCLRLLDGCVRPGDRVADVGSGSGILSIASVLLGAGHGTSIEMDPRACSTARQNCVANAVADRVEILTARVGPEFLPLQSPFDGIVANIESGVLVPLLNGFRSGLSVGGWLILGGILESEAAEVLGHTESRGFRLGSEDREDGWWSGRFRLPG